MPACKTQCGFTLLEVVFAVAILAIGITGFMVLKVSNLHSRNYSREMSQSVVLTRGQLEELLLKEFEAADLAPGAHATAAPLQVGDFAVNVQWNVVDACPSELTKLVTLTGTWNEQGTPRSLTLTQVHVDR